MTASKPPLTPKQARFVAEYARDQNATQAAIRAGYSEHTAYAAGSRLLKHVEVQQALQHAHATAVQVVEERTEEAIGSAAWIIEKAGEVVGRALNAVPVRNSKGEVIEGEWTCNLSAANPALALLAKMHPTVFSPDTTNIDNRTLNLVLPDGTSLDDLKRLRKELG